MNEYSEMLEKVGGVPVYKTRRLSIENRLLVSTDTYTQIAQDHGVSRERVRQFAKAMNIDIRERRQSRRYADFDSSRLSLAARVAWDRAKTAGLETRPIYDTYGTLYTSRLLVNNYSCLIRYARTRKFVSVSYALIIAPCPSSLAGIDFILAVVDLKRVLVIPVSDVRPNMYIRAEPRRSKFGAPAKTDWLKYQDAWNLVTEKRKNG